MLQITNCLNFDQYITYSNLETTLTSMYELYAPHICANISCTFFAPTAPISSTIFEKYDAELFNLFEGIRDEIYDVRGVFSGMSPAYNLTSDASPIGLFSELIRYLITKCLGT